MMQTADEEDLRHFPDLANFPGIPLWKIFHMEGEHPRNGESYIADWRSYDIENTMLAGIKNARPGMLAITLCDRIKPVCGESLEKAAAERGAVVLWWSGPPMTNEERIRNGMRPI